MRKLMIISVAYPALRCSLAGRLSAEAAPQLIKDTGSSSTNTVGTL